MNLVDTILNSLGGNTGRSLADALGADEQDTSRAVKAAVPALLGSLGALASKPDGANNLWSALQKVDDNVVGNFANMLVPGKQDSLIKTGSGLLEGLLGKVSLGALLSVLAKFLGGKTALVTKLLPMLAPFILGSISKSVKSGGLDLGGLVKMLAGQKNNIASAMPAGLLNSLSEAQGLGDLAGFARGASNLASETGRAASHAAGSAARATSAAATRAASPLSWLLPLLLIAAAAIGIWWFMNRPRADVADATKAAGNVAKSTVDAATQLTGQFNDFFKNMGTSLGGITDVASAQAALPKLEEMGKQLDSLTSLFKGLPATAQPALVQSIKSATTQFETERKRIEALPGVGEILKSIFDQIFRKLASFVTG